MEGSTRHLLDTTLKCLLTYNATDPGWLPALGSNLALGQATFKFNATPEIIDKAGKRVLHN